MNSQTIAIIVFTASIANYYYFVNNALAQIGSTPSTAPGSTPSTAPGSTPSTAPGSTPSTAPGSTPGTAPGSTPGTAPGSTIIELSPLIQSIRMHVNETVVALQNKNIQGAITHLKLINNQLADLSMINARGIINGTKSPVH